MRPLTHKCNYANGIMKVLQFKKHAYIFSPSLFGTLVSLICIALFIKFGLWQYNKAQQKMMIQAAYNLAKTDDALQFPLDLKNNAIDEWNYKKVKVSGVYEPKFQFLLDNQVEGNRVGYHVITPLKIDQSAQYVLINRGWILGKDTHTELPVFVTPTGKQTVIGQIWVPSKKIFTLEAKANMATNDTEKTKVDATGASITLATQPWQAVWQNMNMERYQHSVPFVVSKLALKLDQTSDAGGFVRNWQVPVARIATNIGYAYQWFGFALATLLIYIYVSVTKVSILLKPEQK
jgi:surfeit locus 1 family protein